jgi:mRNA interferase RelE/StbE
MIWTVRFSSSAEENFRKPDKKFKKRILNEVFHLSEFENPVRYPQVKHLTGNISKFCRLRVGQHRVIFSVLKKERIIAGVNIVPRKNAY